MWHFGRTNFCRLARTCSLFACLTLASFCAWSATAQHSKGAAPDFASDEAARTQLTEFENALRTASREDDIIRAIENVSTVQHPQVIQHLIKLLVRPLSEPCLVAVARAIGKQTDRKGVPALLGALKRARKKEALSLAIIEALGNLADASAAGTLVDIMRSANPAHLDEAKYAIGALEKIRDKKAIDPMILLVAELEVRGFNQERMRRRQALQAPLLQALRSLTGEDFQSSIDWRKWWSQSKQTFRVPPPPSSDSAETKKS